MIEVKPYNESWPERFESAKQAMLETVGKSLNIEIEHVGSTSVRGLAAKPTIDICIGVDSLDEAPGLIIKLQTLNYEYLSYLEQMIPDRRYLQLLDSDIHLIHVHIVQKKSPRHLNYILFRDYLIAHPEAVRQYTELKTALAKKFADDREKYTNGKVEFITNLLEVAAAWQSNQCMEAKTTTSMCKK